MMMHYDAQPLVTWKSNQGLLNQLGRLRKAGALYTQVLMLTPSPGSKWYEDTYTSGLAIAEVNGTAVEPHIVDGNYVVASKHPRPWLKQLNLLAGYTYFFNPLRLVVRAGSLEIRDPLGGSRNAAARGRRPVFGLETDPAAAVFEGPGSRDRCRRAAVRHVRPDAHVPPHVRLGLAACCGAASNATTGPPPAASRCAAPRAARLATRCRARQPPNRGSRW